MLAEDLAKLACVRARRVGAKVVEGGAVDRPAQDIDVYFGELIRVLGRPGSVSGGRTVCQNFGHLDVDLARVVGVLELSSGGSEEEQTGKEKQKE